MNQMVRLRVNNEIPAYRTGLVSALDVGTSKIVCVIGQAEAGSLKVLGSALRESSGLKAGTVTSLEQAEECIRDCVAAAENMADARIQNVLISVNCGQPVWVTSRSVMTLDGALVSDDHLRALLADGRARAKLEGHEIIQSAPTDLCGGRGARGEEPVGHVLPAHRGGHACRGGQAVAPCRISSWRWNAAICNVIGHPVRRLCLRPVHPDRG